MNFPQQKKDRQRAAPNLTPLTCGDIRSMSGERWSFGSHEAEKVIFGISRLESKGILGASSITWERFRNVSILRELANLSHFFRRSAWSG